MREVIIKEREVVARLNHKGEVRSYEWGVYAKHNDEWLYIQIPGEPSEWVMKLYIG